MPKRASPVWNSDVDLGIKSDESSAGTSSDEEYEEHDVESFVLCAFVHAACSPLLHGFCERRGIVCSGSVVSFVVGRFVPFVRSVWIWFFFFF